MSQNNGSAKDTYNLNANSAAIRRLAGTYYLQVRKAYFQITSEQNACWLSYIMAKADNAMMYGRHKEGWIQISEKELMEYFSKSRDRQSKIIKRLSDEGFIEVTSEGSPKRDRRRLIRVLAVNIEKRIEKTVTNDALDPMRQRCSGSNAPVFTKVNTNRKNRSVPAKQGTDRSKHKENGFEGEGLIFSFDSSEEKYSELDIQLTRLLRDSVHKKTRNVASWQAPRQARIFAALRRSVGDELLENVVRWYCTNLDKDGSVVGKVVSSPEKFKKHWDTIIDRYGRWQRENPQVEVTDEVKSLAERVVALGWPDRIRSNLPKILQKNVNDYQEFRKTILRLRDELKVKIEENTVKIKKNGSIRFKYKGNPKDKTLLRATENLCEKMPGDLNFMEKWYQRVHRAISKEEKYSKSSLGKFQFCVDHFMFQDMGREWSSSWDKILEEIGHESS